jgi:hypothetical protein
MPARTEQAVAIENKAAATDHLARSTQNLKTSGHTHKLQVEGKRR